MACLSNDMLARLATGTLGRWEHHRALRHLDRCKDCCERYEALAPGLRTALTRFALQDGLVTAAAEAAHGRVLRGVKRELARTDRRAGSPGDSLMPRWAQLAVATGLLLAAVLVGSWLLGGPQVAGRIDGLDGVLFHARAGGPVTRITDDDPEVLAGELLIGLQGTSVDISLEDGSELRISGPLLVVAGAADSGTDLYVYCGDVWMKAGGGSTVSVRASRYAARILGTAEISVRPDEPSRAVLAARRRSRIEARSRGLELMRLALSRDPADPDCDASVSMHALAGRVLLGEDLPSLLSGTEVNLGSGASGPDVRWIGGKPIYLQRQERVLSAEDLAKLPELLARDDDPLRGLAAAARDSRLSDETRALATWLLGELGLPESLPVLSALAALEPPSESRLPDAVRAAAVYALARLGDPEALAYLADPGEAVAEAAVLSAAMADPGRAPDRLLEVAADPSRPDYLRALAAGEAKTLGLDSSIGTLTDLSGSRDPDAAWIADRLLVLHPEFSRYDALLDSSRGTSVERRAEILEWITMHESQTGGAEPLARKTLAPDKDQLLRTAAFIKYLAEFRPLDLAVNLAGILNGPPCSARTAALGALVNKQAVRDAGFDEARGRIQDLLRSPDTPAEDLVPALQLVNPDENTLWRLAIEHPSAWVRRHALQSGTAVSGSAASIAVVRKATTDGDRSVREAAWISLARVRPIQALEAIVASLSERPDRDPEEFLGAFPVVSEFAGPPDRRQALVRALARLLRRTSGSPLGVWTARLLAAHVREGSPLALESLLDAFDDEKAHPYVRAAAAEGLLRAPRTADVAGTLRRALGSDDEMLARLVAAGLSRLRDEIRPDMVAAIRGSATDDYARAALALLPPIDVEEARDLLRGGDSASRALLLRELPGPTLALIPDAVREAAASPDAGIAALAASKLPGGRPAALREEERRRLRLLAEQLGLQRAVDRQTIRTRVALREHREAAAAVAALRAGGDPRALREALMSLSRTGGSGDVAVVLKYLDDSNRGLRGEARRAVRSLICRTAAGLAGPEDDDKPAGSELGRWWSDRKHAFGAPVLSDVFRSLR